MEMLEERQDLSNNDIHERVDRVLSLLQENISAPIIAVYKEKLNATLDINTMRGMLEALAPEVPKEGLDDQALLEQLDLTAWLSLILGRWVLFEPNFKNTTRATIQNLKDVYNGWSHETKFMSLRDARYAASSAHDLLSELGSKEAARKVADIRDELDDLNDDHYVPVVEQRNDPDEVPTMQVMHNKWMGKNEEAEKALSTVNSHDIKSSAARIDRNRTRQVKPPADLLFLKLEIINKNGAASSQMVDIKKPSMIIGRSQMADVELTDPLVSRVHVLITGTTPINLKVTDLNSSNGSCLDGVDLQPNEPTYWDVGKPLIIGETCIVLRHSS